MLAEYETCSERRGEASLLMILLTQAWLPGLRENSTYNGDGWSVSKLYHGGPWHPRLYQPTDPVIYQHLWFVFTP